MDQPQWRPSPYRLSGSGHRVEVAQDPYDEWWLVRDTEDPSAPPLIFSPAQWDGSRRTPPGLYTEQGR